MWLSGKFALDRFKDKVEDEREIKEAARALHELIPESSKAVYSDLQLRRGQETGRWLKSLSEESPQQEESKQQAQAPAVDTFGATRIWLDALFKEFASLTYGFNENAVGTDLFVSMERPQVLETKDETVWYNPVIKSYQGRLTTRYWSLFARGDDKKISVFIFPAEMTLRFKSGQTGDQEMPPFLVAEQGQADGKPTWKIQGESAPASLAPFIAKEMFGDLIRVASGKMSENELFNSKSDAPKLGENVAVGFDANAQPKSQAEANTGLDINVDEMSVFEACDILDKVIDKELKRLYAEAGKVEPASPQAQNARQQISAAEAFRMRVVDAFENYTQESHSIVGAETVAAGK